MISNASLSRLQAIDQKILDLLEERAAIAADTDDEDDENLPKATTAELVQWWVEEAMERGLDDEQAIEKACRAITQLRK